MMIISKSNVRELLDLFKSIFILETDIIDRTFSNSLMN